MGASHSWKKKRIVLVGFCTCASLTFLLLLRLKKLCKYHYLSKTDFNIASDNLAAATPIAVGVSVLALLTKVISEDAELVKVMLDFLLGFRELLLADARRMALVLATNGVLVWVVYQTYILTMPPKSRRSIRGRISWSYRGRWNERLLPAEGSLLNVGWLQWRFGHRHT